MDIDMERERGKERYGYRHREGERERKGKRGERYGYRHRERGGSKARQNVGERGRGRERYGYRHRERRESGGERDMDIVMEREGGVKQDRVWERERSGRGKEGSEMSQPLSFNFMSSVEKAI